MTDHCEIELGIHRRDADSYGIELRFSRPGDESDVRLSRPGPSVAALGPETLAPLMPEPESSGRILGEQLFGDSEILAALRSAQSLDLRMRIRLFIGPSAPELHALPWELVRLPGDDAYLTANENILFSRYLSSSDWRPVHLRPEGHLTALVAVANPADLEAYGLAKVKAEDEVARARVGLGDDIEPTVLSETGAATLDAIIDAARGGVDILYLVAHGVLIEGQPMLFLDGDESAGMAALTPGVELVSRLQGLRERPLLVVLASCQSAGEGDVWSSSDGGVLAALGPRLVEIGIPAVVAMQGNILMETVARFLPAFFTALRADGHVDHAMAVARDAIRGQRDWWAPALFMRLKNGRIWYTPGFGDQAGELEQWKSVLRNIQRGKCTPIIGPGVNESLLGSRRDIARRWAETFNFPMASHQQDDLPEVAQFIAVNQGPSYTRDELEAYLRQELEQKIRREVSLPAQQTLLDAAPDALLEQGTLSELFSLAWQLARLENPFEPNWVLAQLPLPLYITTSPTNALLDALAEADHTRRDGTAVKKRPRMEICKWNEDLEFLPSVYDNDPDYRPTAEEPLVYQLFGNLDEPDSVVLTEDDYFDFLIGVTSNNELIPKFVRRALVDSALLFLGFGLDEQDFRVLFRSVMQRGGRSRRRGYAHVAAQINPEEGRILEPERARDYLESYFEDAAISIFWGSADDFIRELQARL